MKNIYILPAFFLLVLIVIGCDKHKSTSNQRPNFLILFVDDWGYYDVGFRNDDFYTPNIDQFRETATVFENSYTASPTCSPSRVALYTGRHPAELQFYRHSLGDKVEGEFNMSEDDPAELPSRQWLPLDVTTHAEMLKRHNYNTVFLGKWHLGGPSHGPSKQGFDTVYSNPSSGHPNSYYPPYFQNAGFQDAKEREYLTDYLTDKAVNYLENYSSDEPFLMQFSYYNVHGPPVGRKDYIKKYKQRGFSDYGLRRFTEFSPKTRSVSYGAQISAMDASVGRVLAALERTGHADDTIVILISDQGSRYANSPLRGSKIATTALYEGSAKIPFLMRWPGVTETGSTLTTHVQNTDIYPTMAEIVADDSTHYDNLEGTSLVGLIRSDKPLDREALYAYRSYTSQYASVLTNDNWKLIAYRNDTFELFKVDEDIAELHDLAGKYPEKVQELADMLKGWKKENDIP